MTGLATGLAVATAGCLGAESTTVRCSGYGENPTTGPLVQVRTLEGAEQVSLGIVVSDDAPADDDLTAIVVRTRDGDRLADVPLRDNRDMSDLDPADHPAIRADGELYAVPLGPPPQHGFVDVGVVGADGTVADAASYRFNCYSPDGDLP